MDLPTDFLALCRRIGADPLLIQGPGGNTSIKLGGVMWIKASGTELADAGARQIFVAVDPEKARSEIDGAGDGTCRAALLDPKGPLRPSIETTFHALLPQRFVVHVHSIATIGHATSAEGQARLVERLAGLDWIWVPYVKPGVPLTQGIREVTGGRAPKVIVLENHGLIVAGETVEEVAALLEAVEARLKLPVLVRPHAREDLPAVDGWASVPEVATLALDPRMRARATAGSYYPDHVVFLGPALRVVGFEALREDREDLPPAVICEDRGVYLKADATPAQRAMLRCLYDVLGRIPSSWTLKPIGLDDEAALLDWDAEKYRQALAARGG